MCVSAVCGLRAEGFGDEATHAQYIEVQSGVRRGLLR